MDGGPVLAGLIHDFQKPFMKPLHRILPSELPGCLQTLLSQTFTEFRGIDHSSNRSGQRPRIACRNYQAVLFVDGKLRHSPAIGQHHGNPTSHCFKRRKTETLKEGGEHEEIEAAVIIVPELHHLQCGVDLAKSLWVCWKGSYQPEEVGHTQSVTWDLP